MWKTSSASIAVPVGESGTGEEQILGDHKTPFSTLAPSLDFQSGAGFHTLSHCVIQLFLCLPGRNLKCINNAVVSESSLQVNFASTEIWAYIHLGISQMTSCSKRGLHENLKSKYSWLCRHPYSPIYVHISKGCCTLFGIKTLISPNLHD